MFISALEIFKIGIGPSSSHTVGPMVAANDFVGLVSQFVAARSLTNDLSIRCTLKGSLAYTGKGHATDRAIKAYTAASLAIRGSGEHFMPLDNCIAAMRQTGLEMSEKYKETALGGLAVSITEC